MIGPSAPYAQSNTWSAAAIAAKQALTRANAIVDQDRRNHSPSCVACDQKLVDKAQQQLAAAQTTAAQQATTSPSPASGFLLNIVA